MNLVSLLILGIRSLLGYSFLTSGWAKLRSGSAFEHDAAEYQLLPLPFIKLFAKVLPLAWGYFYFWV